jgi:hypothetical protein
MSGMMVLHSAQVECSAKIAMTTLLGMAAAMGLLPNHIPPRLIFLGRCIVHIR